MAVMSAIADPSRTGMLPDADAVLEALPVGVLLLGADGVVQQANPAATRLLGDHVVGESWPRLRARSDASTSAHDGDLVLEDGRRLEVAQQTLAPRPGRLLMLSDVTEKRRIASLLARHRRLTATSEMAAVLAHQIRTPLSASLLYATNAGRDELPAAQRGELLGKAVACLHDLERLVGEMLQFARGSAIPDQQFTLDALLDGVETALGGILQPGQSLHISRAPAAVLIAGNRETLAGALLNLATNALAAAGPSARLRIIAHASRLQTELSVIDNGPGIDGRLAARIFEPFFTSRPDGTGLGLAVARSIARAHHGDIVLADGRPGHTTFVLRLPVIQQDGAAGATGGHAA